MRKTILLMFAVLLSFAPSAFAQKGTLIIVGGGPRPKDIADRFAELAGGRGAKILIFPQASSDAAGSGKASVESWQPLGLEGRVVLVTHEEAMTADTSEMFKGITGIWFPGGDQARITRAIGGTPIATAIRNHYHAGAVVGGTSAGAAIMTTPMITGDEKRIGGARGTSDSTASFISIDRDNVVTIDGLGFLPGAIVDQHFIRRKRHNRLISLTLEHPQLIAAGIDEGTAIEVRPDKTWKILGMSVVVIYDARKAKIDRVDLPLGGSDIRMHVLPAGSVFNPASGAARLP